LDASDAAADRRIVLLDDAPVECALFERFARRNGWVVATTESDAASGLAAVTACRPSVIVVDGRLPPAGALQVLPALFAAAPAALVLVIVAFEEAALAREALRLGAAGYMQRPLLPGAVADQLALVARTLAARRE
jgi:DNA-binding NarL/FixJ family response regulator